MNNAFNILGVSQTSSKEEIKAAYRKMAMQHHPDRNPGDQAAADKFKEIQAAYEFLSTDKPQKNVFDFTSIFEEFFTVKPRRARGKDVHKTIELTLEEVLNGVKKTVKIDTKIWCEKCEGNGYTEWKPCQKCSGSGKSFVKQHPFNVFSTCNACEGTGRKDKIDCDSCKGSGCTKTGDKEIYMDIPPGIEDGTQVRGGTLGDPIKGGTPGDLILTIKIQEHKFLKRDGDDLYVEVPVSYAELVLGTEIVIPCLGRSALLKIDKGSSFNSHIIIKKMGLPRLRGKGRGNLIVILKMQIPEKMEENYKKVIEELLELDKSKIDRTFLS